MVSYFKERSGKDPRFQLCRLLNFQNLNLFCEWTIFFFFFFLLVKKNCLCFIVFLYMSAG